MATYKVLQDIEAEDKLLGPLTLKQFIFAAIAAVCLYLSFYSLTKHAPLLLLVFLPPGLIGGFLAWPWSRDQPTEVWLLAKIRFFLKPRRRIWDQDGMQELVTITVPKKIEHQLTNDLSQTEVKSRLHALADTIDSRGWAIKNINVNLTTSPGFTMPDPTSDRLIDVASLPQEVPAIDVVASDDMLDTQNRVAAQLDQMIGASTKQHHEQLLKQVRSGQPPTNDQPQPMVFATPGASQPLPGQPMTADEQAVMAQLHPDPGRPAAFGHMKVINPPGQADDPAAPSVTATPDPAILELANNDDLNVATIARQAHKKRGPEPPDEVVVPIR